MFNILTDMFNNYQFIEYIFINDTNIKFIYNRLYII